MSLTTSVQDFGVQGPLCSSPAAPEPLPAQRRHLFSTTATYVTSAFRPVVLNSICTMVSGPS